MKLMDNKKITYPLSIFSVIYIVFIGWICSLCYAYYFEYESLRNLYTVYCLINILFAVPIVLSRKTVSTAIAMIIMLPLNLLLTVLSIETGMWMLFIPSLVINLVGFFALNLKYTTKALLTTLTAVLYVIGIMGYILYVTLFGKFPFHNFSESKRYEEVNSPSGNYRYIVYVKDYASTQKIDIYVEPTAYDKDYGLVKMKRYYDDMRIYSSKEGLPKEITWQDDKTIIVQIDDERVETKTIDIKE